MNVDLTVPNGMSAASYTEFVAVTRREGEALLAAGRLGLDAPVPTCGDWDLRRLLGHVGRVYRYAGTIVRERVTEAPPRAAGPGENEDPLSYCADGLDGVIQGMTGVDPDAPVWNWSGGPQLARFWARRMAHESLIHRWDAQNAHGVAQEIEPAIAADALDEVFDVLAPLVVARDQPALPEGTIRLHAPDVNREWLVSLGPGQIAVGAAMSPPDAEITGPVARLLLAWYGRLGTDDLDVNGDATLITAWQQQVNF